MEFEEDLLLIVMSLVAKCWTLPRLRGPESLNTCIGRYTRHGAGGGLPLSN